LLANSVVVLSFPVYTRARKTSYQRTASDSLMAKWNLELIEAYFAKPHHNFTTSLKLS